MGGVVCKQVIDEGVWGLSESLRKTLTEKELHQDLIPNKIRVGLIDKLAKIDTVVYTGGKVPVYGLAGIMIQLEDYGLISPDVWKVFARPQIDTSVGFRVTEDYVIE